MRPATAAPADEPGRADPHQRAEVTEAWQESGRDFVTVHLAASLLDYTVDDSTGSVVEGSQTAPQNVEEYWTFARPVGHNPWQLTAIQTLPRSRWLLAAVAAIVGLAIAVMVALPRLVDTPRVQSLIAGTASQALARSVKFRSVSVSVAPYPAVRLHGLEVAEDPAFGGGPFLRLDEADLRLKLWPLLRGQIEFATLVLKQPTVALIQGADGRWNFATLGATTEPRPAAPRGRALDRRAGGRPAPVAVVAGPGGRRHRDLRRPRQGRGVPRSTG